MPELQKNIRAKNDSSTKSTLRLLWRISRNNSATLKPVTLRSRTKNLNR